MCNWFIDNRIVAHNRSYMEQGMNPADDRMILITDQAKNITDTTRP